MVDVGHKAVTCRRAVAECRLWLPAEVAQVIRDTGGRSKKGPVFDTAIVAGVMGAKRTHELIPFCHPLGLDNCRITIELVGDEVVIQCETSVQHRTGVEMEALTGASIAALTVYDMCKALSQDIRIVTTRLVAKSGGNHDFDLRAADENNEHNKQ